MPLGWAGHRAWFLALAGCALVETSGEVEIGAHRRISVLAAGGPLAYRPDVDIRG